MRRRLRRNYGYGMGCVCAPLPSLSFSCAHARARTRAHSMRSHEHARTHIGRSWYQCLHACEHTHTATRAHKRKHHGRTPTKSPPHPNSSPTHILFTPQPGTPREQTHTRARKCTHTHTAEALNPQPPCGPKLARVCFVQHRRPRPRPRPRPRRPKRGRRQR
jgi:hypothetical protein